jgi:hypothetical protein
MKPTFKLNTREFDATLKRYMALSKRTPKEVTDTKGFFIARAASRLTDRANYQKMANELGQELKVYSGKRASRQGRLTMKGGKTFNTAATAPAPLLALIINARRGRKGQPGLYGATMKEAFRRVFGARARSIAFIAASWLPAIRTLAPLSSFRGAPRQGTGLRQVGQAKGFAIPSRGGWKAKTVIANTADPKHDTNDALLKWGLPGLQKAFDHEARSMKAYIEKKLAENARRAGIRIKQGLSSILS